MSKASLTADSGVASTRTSFSRSNSCAGPKKKKKNLKLIIYKTDSARHEIYPSRYVCKVDGALNPYPSFRLK